MTKDKGTHKVIREEIFKKVKSLKGIDKAHCSHGDDGDIYFFKKTNGKRIDFARPDILLIRKDRRALIVEIELSDSPKHLMGVACAVYSSGDSTHKRQPINIEKKALLLVLNSKKICKKDSGKPEQIKEIKSLIRKTINFEDFNIVTEKNAINAIIEWMNSRKMRGDICA